MAQFTIYRSSDVGAPVLNGITGSLITVLDAVLVNGYGSQTNAGWAKPYSSSDNMYATYQQGPGSSSCYMWVQDTGSVASGKEAIFRGYETLTSIFGGTGSLTHPFPNSIQSVLTSNGLAIRKCNTTHSLSSSAWIAAADSRGLYFFAKTGDVANTYFSFAFGDIYSYIPNDPYKCAIIGRSTENIATLAGDNIYTINGLAIAGLVGNYIQRSFSGTGVSTNIGKHVDGVRNNAGAANLSAGTYVFPNPADGKIYLSPVWITDNGTLRGQMRGFYNLGHTWASLNDGDVFSGSAELAGKTFLTVKSPGYIIETSNTLE